MKRLFSKHITLSNGQILSVYGFRWNSGSLKGSPLRFRAAEFGCIIGQSKRANNDRYHCRGKKHNLIRSTGKCGIEGLRISRDELLAFRDRCRIGSNINTLVVCGADEKRQNAYRYLDRYGFIELSLGGEHLCWVLPLNKEIKDELHRALLKNITEKENKDSETD